MAPLDRAEGREAEETGKSPLEEENQRLKQVSAEKTLEVNFFRTALPKVASRRQARGKLFNPQKFGFIHSLLETDAFLTREARRANAQKPTQK